jgi:hypothetical protein
MFPGNSADSKLRKITEMLDSGQIKEARAQLRELLLADRNHLAAWELLWKRGTYNVKEEQTALNNILRIKPDHKAARQRLEDIRSADQSPSFSSGIYSDTSQLGGAFYAPPDRKKKKKTSDIALFFIFLLIPVVCLGVSGLGFYQAGYLDKYLFASQLTATAMAERNAACQQVIQRAMNASGQYCDQIDSNKACYGNNTIQADLVPGSTDQFSERGDVVDVEKVERLHASPLMVDSEEWGVAVLKVFANLPRSLPGQTVTMVVFGNTTLDNESGNLESFFFSSELGQIQCEKVPKDGLMISVPEGEGVTLTINGAELTLMGDASITAEKNGKMEVSLYEGAGSITSDGESVYFGAGEQVEVQLGGENGTESISPPSAPKPISQDDLDTACSLTGQYCDEGQITPVAGEEVEQLIQEGLGITPTATITNIPTVTRPPTFTPYVMPSAAPTFTQLVLPSKTFTPVPTSTKKPTSAVTATRTRTPTRTITPGGPTLTPTRTATRTNTPTRTFTPSLTPTRSLTPTPSNTFTPSNTATFTPSSTSTATSSLTFTNTSTSTSTFTPTVTFTPSVTNTPDPWSDPVCSNVNVGTLIDSGMALDLPITNNSGGTITVDGLIITWNVGTATRILDESLDGNQIGNANETSSPSEFPNSNPFVGGVANRQIGDGATESFTANFQTAPTGSGYTIEVHFDIGCRISASK